MPITFRRERAGLNELAIQYGDLARRVKRFLASARLRRYALLTALENGEEPVFPTVAADPRIEIDTIEGTLRQYATELRQSASGEERKKLEAELADLSDRSLLGSMLDTIRAEVDRLKAIRFLGQCIADTNTTAITKLGNKIADDVITPKMRDRFQLEISRLSAEKVRIEIFRSGGQQGSPYYKLQFSAKPEAIVGDILSEGEQTCVAFAAFLTELATAQHQSALVFDDPVSSLDHKWRKRVATRLVEEAGDRQIIVFTHDLIFVTDMEDLATQRDLPVHVTTVMRGSAGAGVVADGLPWKGKSVEERIDKLEKRVTQAKVLFDDNSEEQYHAEACDIYSELRTIWERTIEEIVFHRVILRHRDYIDARHLRKATVLDDQDCDTFHAGYKRCCDITDAHDKSRGRNADVPSPNEIQKEIWVLNGWVKTLRARQKVIR